MPANERTAPLGPLPAFIYYDKNFLRVLAEKGVRVPFSRHATSPFQSHLRKEFRKKRITIFADAEHCSLKWLKEHENLVNTWDLDEIDGNWIASHCNENSSTFVEIDCSFVAELARRRTDVTTVEPKNRDSFDLTVRDAYRDAIQLRSALNDALVSGLDSAVKLLDRVYELGLTNFNSNPEWFISRLWKRIGGMNETEQLPLTEFLNHVRAIQKMDDKNDLGPRKPKRTVCNVCTRPLSSHPRGLPCSSKDLD